MTILYNPSDAVFSVLFRFRGTIIPLVCRKPTFWVLMTIQIVLLSVEWYWDQLCRARGIVHGGEEEGCRLPSLDWDAVQLPAGLLVFFLVFYGDSCYYRFFQLWAHVVELVRLLLEFVARVNLLYPDDRKIAVKWRTARYLLASLAMLFDMLGGDLDAGDPFEGGGVDDREYGAFMRLKLLSTTEVAALKKYRGVKCVIPVKWALLCMKDSMDFKSRGDVASKYYDNLEDMTCEFQSRCHSIILLLQQPVPFAYFHILKMQMIIVLLLVCYALVNVFDGAGAAARHQRPAPQPRLPTASPSFLSLHLISILTTAPFFWCAAHDRCGAVW